ncbi:methionyl-tRNA formyltransferase [Urechidicola vernalis]|uniref:Methionyl-tRNA formyltransferase n=1 Tax=Urechidicola vernalis TaxID=3075600 RepID=A0ABU2Y1J8_9FLAO|nr:methionyl-tRNA formyltransferase [Urechidicola sp. P050]MDT0552084.1 methionyl-tRNA formyltransferase [Urechidicola sp. P050]
MRDLRIVFMGTPDFAVTILKGLLESGQNVVGVITAPDKPAGRGRKINQSAVKKYALEQGLTILQPTNLKSETFLNELKGLNANLQIVVAFRMLPTAVWKLPEFGTFNLHASLLPQYRGAAPINWALINGETKTGVTTFFIDDKIDTGEIILQKAVEVSSTETVGQLHDRLMHLGSDVVNKTVNLIADDAVITTKQTSEDLKFAPKIHTDTCKIDWSDTLDNIYNKVRGLNPYPAAWTTILDNDQSIQAKVYDVRKEIIDHNFEIGTIVSSKKELKIATAEGFLIIDAIKLAGKRKMDTKSLLNGHSFSLEARIV